MAKQNKEKLKVMVTDYYKSHTDALYDLEDIPEFKIIRTKKQLIDSNIDISDIHDYAYDDPSYEDGLEDFNNEYFISIEKSMDKVAFIGYIKQDATKMTTADNLGFIGSPEYKKEQSCPENGLVSQRRKMKITKKDIDELFKDVKVVGGGGGVFEQGNGSVDVKRVEESILIPEDKLEIILYILNIDKRLMGE